MSDYITTVIKESSTRTSGYAQIIGAQKAYIDIMLEYLEGKRPYTDKKDLIEVIKNRMVKADEAFNAANKGLSIKGIL